MNDDDRDRVARQFGVATRQVERDHLISHLLGYLSREYGDRITFIGGTALARTHLPHGRLSEDIDLIAIGSRKVLAQQLDEALPRALARSHGRLRVEPRLSEAADIYPVIVTTERGLTLKIQLLSSHDRIVWPYEPRVIEQRYRDAPAAKLFVPTLPAFAASKTAAWVDRGAARDLWDLWALSKIGAIDGAAAQLYRRYGPTNRPPGRHVFETSPSDAEWHTQLAGQTRLEVSAGEALAVVSDAWARAVSG